MGFVKIFLFPIFSFSLCEFRGGEEGIVVVKHSPTAAIINNEVTTKIVIV